MSLHVHKNGLQCIYMYMYMHTYTVYMEVSVGPALTYNIMPLLVLYKELTGTGAPPVGLPLGTVHTLVQWISEFTICT